MKLICKDNEQSVEIDKEVLQGASKTIEKLLMDDPTATEITLRNASIDTLRQLQTLILGDKENVGDTWDATNVAFMELLKLANYLEIYSVIDFCTRKILKTLQGKSSLEMQKMYGVVISEAEKEEARKILDEEE